MEWIRENVVTAISLALAVVGIGIGIWAAWYYGNRRRKLVFEWHATPLIARQPGVTPELKVMYRDLEVDDPYLVTVRIKNVGPTDLASGHFDGGEPIRILFGCTMYGLVCGPSAQSRLRMGIGDVGTDACIAIEPGLLRQHEEWSAELIVSGRPDPMVESSLVDTDMIDGATYRAQQAAGIAIRTARLLAESISIK